MDLDFDDILSASILLDVANAGGRRMCLLHPRQWGDVQADLATTTGAAAERLDIQAGMDQITGGYRTTLLSEIDVYVSAHVPTANAGADRAGAIWCRGAVGYADASIMPDARANAIYAGFLNGSPIQGHDRVRTGL